jgi:hypothetical protein
MFQNPVCALIWIKDRRCIAAALKLQHWHPLWGKAAIQHPLLPGCNAPNVNDLAP